MIRFSLMALMLTVPAAGMAQTTPAPAAPVPAADGSKPQRIRNVQLQQGQACPRGTTDEIIVCDTITEPYRIPKQFREDAPIAAANQSWANRAATIDQVSKVAGGLPDTCSPIGSGGQSGCALQANRAYAAERRAAARAAESVPGGAD